MSDTRSLSSQLVQLDDERLADVLEHSPAVAVRSADFFELADNLLAGDSIAALLTDAPRAVIEWLISDQHSPVPDLVTDFFAHHGVARMVLLETEDPARPRSTVPATLRDGAAPSLAAIRDNTAGTVPPLPARGEIDERAAFERGYHAVTALSETLRQSERGNTMLTARLALPLTEAQRIAETVGLDADDLQLMTRIALRSGFGQNIGGRLGVTSRGAAWQRRTTVEQWCELIHEWWRTLSFPIRSAIAAYPTVGWADELDQLVRWAFPATTTDPEQTVERARAAEVLGLVEGARPGSAALALARSQTSRLAEIARAALPPNTGAVYVQHDMTVVTTGPTTADADEFLHRIADTEHRSYAARFRISEASLRRGIRTGLHSDGIRDTLLSISPVPLPQPLEYLLRQLSATADLEPAPGAHDPVIEQPTAVSSVKERAILATVARLREGEGDGSDSAWIERQLREAARLKTTVLVTVRMPDGSETEFALAPSSAVSGRLRARDVRADVERTLPIALVSGIRAVE